MKKGVLFAIAALLAAAMAAPANAATGKRVSITGEVIDSWCYITEIMFAEGTAHHQCALWCAAGGIPVGVLGEDGQVYMVLKLEGNATSVANPAILKIQTHKVTVDGDVYERDGIRYLVVNKVVDDSGIVKETHEEYGIQPFGN
ncbi:MAG: hypothetical protein WD767_11415 [Alphaproteobacteria bacterium]